MNNKEFEDKLTNHINNAIEFENKVISNLKILSTDISGLKENLLGLTEDISGLTEDIYGLKEYIFGLKTDVFGLSNKFDYLDDRFDEQTKELKKEIKLQGVYLNQAFNRMTYIQSSHFVK